MKKVNVIIGPGSIGQAIARRVSAGKHVVLADLREEHAAAAAKIFSDAGFDVTAASVDVSNRASVEALIDKARSLVRSTALSTLQGYRRRKLLRKRS
jgi:NAD(P)-dependent dehydrogenase (short-subunit alcohol dehydrogenase family)